ncbi:MAG: SCP2 sterol-binding domain-containing protein [Hyphomonadaceae bacterium]|jgi:putative sterol carrier protein|nr:SCP2 sterol-binding domain-containing protein [Hyphomonadaceae bacterium]
MTLEEITTQMRARVAAKGGIKGKTIKFNFGEDGCVRIVGSSDTATVDNDNGAADCTVNVAKTDFLDISAGKLNSMNAFMTGKLKVEGDMGLAMQLGTLLG